jgi:hypothetical protein
MTAASKGRKEFDESFKALDKSGIDLIEGDWTTPRKIN